jgi:hypothetical protein
LFSQLFSRRACPPFRSALINALTPTLPTSTFPAMPLRRIAMAGILAVWMQLGVGACDSPPQSSSVMFAPTAMRIHPIFTQLIDIHHTGKPDGIEAQLEFDDQFGDPTKAAGKVLFELFSYRKDAPDPRGTRLGGPWVGSLATLDEQNARWNTTLRTYLFQLSDPAVRTDQSYVLSAIFQLSGGGRFFDHIILPAVAVKKPTTQRHGGGFFDSVRGNPDADHEHQGVAAPSPVDQPTTLPATEP